MMSMRKKKALASGAKSTPQDPILDLLDREIDEPNVFCSRPSGYTPEASRRAAEAARQAEQAKSTRRPAGPGARRFDSTGDRME